MKQPEISIIVVSFNTAIITKNMLDSLIESLKDTKITYEIIVVDNNSEDESVKIIKQIQKKCKKIRLIESKKNLGFGKANNLAVKKARSDYILFLNSDIVVLNNAIQKLLRFYKKNQEKIAFLGGKLLNKDLSIQPSVGRFFSPLVVFATLFLRGDYWGLTRYSPSKPEKVDWISGACILTTKNWLTRLKGFDEKIFMYMEEVDLLYRAHLINANTFFYPNAEFIHLGSISSRKKSYPIIQVFKGLKFFYQKYYSNFNLKILLFMLKLKALIGIFIGLLLNNDYLKETYAKAFKNI